MTKEVNSNQLPITSTYDLRIKQLGEEALEQARETGRHYCLNLIFKAVAESDPEQDHNNQPDTAIIE